MAKINYDKGIHRHWMKVAREEKSDNPENVVKRIKERLENGYLTEADLIYLGIEYKKVPHAFVEMLLSYRVGFY